MVHDTVVSTAAWARDTEEWSEWSRTTRVALREFYCRAVYIYLSLGHRTANPSVPLVDSV